MANIIGFAAVGVISVTLVLAIISTAIPYWNTIDEPTHDVHSGLWKYCITPSGGDETCTTIDLDTLSDSDERNLKSTRAMMILGVIFSPVAAVIGVLVLVVMKDKKVLFFGAAGCAFVAGLFFMVAFGIYADHFKDDTNDYGACFALAIVSWILAWVAGGLFVAAKIMDKD